MAASYPGSVKSFTALNVGDIIQDTDPEVAYDEITALEQALLTNGLAHNLFPDNSSNARSLGTSAKFWGLSYLKGVALLAAAELTIATDAVTVTQGYHRIDTESDAASDNLSTITAGAGVVEGFLLVLRAENVARVVTVKDGTGNLLLNGDCVLSATDRTLTLIYDGTNWREVARSVSAGTLQNVDDTQVTTSTGSETALLTYTIPANFFNENGKTLRLVAMGTLAADTDSKRIRVRLGGLAGTVAADIQQNSASLTHWRVEVLISRIGSNSQRLLGRAEYGSGTTTTTQATLTVTTAAQTDTATIDLVVSGTGVNAGDIVYEASVLDVVRS